MSWKHLPCSVGVAVTRRPWGRGRSSEQVTELCAPGCLSPPLLHSGPSDLEHDAVGLSCLAPPSPSKVLRNCEVVHGEDP